jgi:O-antigen ligase
MIQDLLNAVPDWLLTALPLAGGLCAGAILLFLLSLVFWTGRDISARSKDVLARVAAVALVLLLPVVGVVIYLLLRPRETLAERYEREMVEELLARELSLAALQRRRGTPSSATSSAPPDPSGTSSP